MCIIPKIAEIVTSSAEVEGCDTRNRMGDSPLAWAAKNGHEEVVRILLERDDVDPNKQNEDGETPLWSAAKVGHEGW